MFYSNQILARKGPLGLVWIAAHLDKQLKRQQINSTSIPASVDSLLDPEVPLALRLSGQLMLGVVRIYGRKVAYLQQDCNDALVKIRVALRPTDDLSAPAPLEAVTTLHPAEAAAARQALSRRAKRGGAGAASKEGGGEDGAAAADGADVELLLWGEGFEWEQGLLLGQEEEGLLGGYGLPGFRSEPNRLSLGLAPSRSGLGSQDVSSMFGMYSSSQDEGLVEAFGAEDEEAAAVWDLDDIEVERLRAAPSQSQPDSGVSGLLGGGTPAEAGAGAALGGGGGGKGGGSSGAGPHAAGAAGVSDDGDHGYTPGVTPVSGRDHGSPAGTAGGPDSAGGDLAGLEFDAAAAAAGLPATPGAAAAATSLDDGFVDDDAGAATAAAAAATHHDLDLSGPELDLDLGLDLAHMLPDTPGGGAAAAGDQATQEQLEPGTAAAAAAEAGTAVAGTPAKTFQRRNTRQQSQQPAGAAVAAGHAAAGRQQQQEGVGEQGHMEVEEEGAGQEHTRKAAAAARAARKRRASGVLGQKRRVVLDVAAAGEGEDDAPAAGDAARRGRNTRSRAATELPAAEIRALLADRAPLLDRERGERASRQLRQQAVASLASGSAPLAHQQLAAAAAAPGEAAGPPVVLPGLPMLGTSLAAGVAGGLGLPLELQQLFASARARAGPPRAATRAPPAAEGPAAAAAAAGVGVAPLASLAEIGGLPEEGIEDDDDDAACAGLQRPLAGTTRCSLSLSLHGTPGSAGAAAAAAGSSGATPGTRPLGSAGAAGFTPGSAGFRDEPGYSAGSAGAGGVLCPLDDVNRPGPDDVIDDAPTGDAGWLMGGGGHDDAGGDEFAGGAPSAAAAAGYYVGDEEGSDKENPPLGPAGGLSLGSAGKGAGGGARLAWPADAETLMEQEGAAGHEVSDGGFTARTRLVVRHLQHAAAGGAAAAGAVAMTPNSRVGGKRRISAAALAPLGEADDKEGGGGAAAAGTAAAGPVLSFDSLTQGHGRLDACRWFYEVLVLTNKGFVAVQQDDSYGDIKVTPNLAAMARV